MIDFRAATRAGTRCRCSTAGGTRRHGVVGRRAGTHGLAEPAAARPASALLERRHRQARVVELLPVELGGLLGARSRRSPGRCCGCGRRSRSRCRTLTPGMYARERVRRRGRRCCGRRCRTITRQVPPRPLPGPPVRGRSIVVGAHRRGRAPRACASSGRGRARAGPAAAPARAAPSPRRVRSASPARGARRSRPCPSRRDHRASVAQRLRAPRSRWRRRRRRPRRSGSGRAAAGRQPASEVERGVPRLDVDVRRRRGRQREAARRDRARRATSPTSASPESARAGSTTWCEAWPGVYSTRQPSHGLAAARAPCRFVLRHRRRPRPTAGRMLVAVEPRRRCSTQLARGRPGAARRARARRPASSGKRRTSAPVAPAWSRWMCVEQHGRAARASPRPSSSVSTRRRGPGIDDHAVAAPQRRSPGRGPGA